MGYSHYWQQKQDLPEEIWADVKKAAADIVAYHQTSGGCPLEVLSDEEYVDINGEGDDAHENLVLDKTATAFSFCKTARKPYDVVVVAVLCALASICKDYVKVTSDGDRDDWLEGQKLACDALGRVEIPETI